ncbi:MAG TPA: class I SAM-dependent methyltransferase [Oligoflexia bacterium]|nr:class I SAM-dependent methyltransferase [Oligoflexia bacterium]HMP27439.1 class I SAM-dependent methyltransferase [Oligoflexia bacterium]
MGNYLTYLQSISSPTLSKSKRAYIDYNLGNFINTEGEILEIGPGLGEFLEYLTKNKKPKAIDIVENDSAVTEFLSKQFEIRNLFQVNIEESVALSNKLKNYDFILMLQVLEHIKPEMMPSLLKTLYKHLKPNGVLAIVVPNGANPLSTVERYSDFTHTTLFSENSLKQLCSICDLPDGSFYVTGYEIPPITVINRLRRLMQSCLHSFLKGVLILNGGVFFKTLHPNIVLIVEKKVIVNE